MDVRGVETEEEINSAYERKRDWIGVWYYCSYYYGKNSRVVIVVVVLVVVAGRQTDSLLL